MLPVALLYRHISVVLAVIVLTALVLFAPASRAADAQEPWTDMAYPSFRHQADTAFAFGTAFAQDHAGFIWMGTQTGLVRWDGVRARRYRADANKPGFLPNGYIQAMLVDREGRLWVGTSAGGLARYDPGRDAFVTIGTGPQGLSNARVSALAEDGDGGIWVGTGGGLERIGADGRVYAAASGAPQVAAASLPQGGVDALLRDAAGGLWIGTRGGLYHRANDRSPLKVVPLAAPGQSEPAVILLRQDSAGHIWVGTRDRGAFSLDADAHPHRVVARDGSLALQVGRIFAMVEKSPGILWFGIEGGGILELDLAHGRTRRILHRADVTDSLYDDEVQALFRARGGQIFVATIQAMSVHDVVPQGFLTIRTIGPDGAKMNAHQLLVRPDGRVWMGTVGGVIRVIDPLRGEVGVIHPRADATGGGLPGGRVLALLNGPGNSVFIGTQQGLFRSDDDGRHVRRVAVPTRPATAAVWALGYRDGVLWVGGLDGVWRLSLGRGGDLTVLRHEEASLGDARVAQILPLPDGSAWLGTRAGLARLPAGGPVELLPTDAADATRVPPGFVSSLALDRQDRLWLATYGNGVAVLERTDRAGRRWFRRIGMAEGLPDSGVNKMVSGRDGAIWLSTDNGLARIDPATLAVRKLGEAEGVHIPTYWGDSGALAANGDILFGAPTGLTVVRPGSLRQRHDNAPVAVTRIVLGERKLPAAPFNLGAKASAILTIAPDDRERGFSLEYTALDFAAPGSKRYSYRLAGFDRDWIDADHVLRRVSYNNLPPGDYTLQLRSSEPDGGAPVQLDVPVRALPMWYQQGWVPALAALALAALFAGLMQARTSLLRRRQRELEAMVAERTSELRATQARLETMAYGDALTGLPNRRLFADEIRRMAAQVQRDGVPFTLLLIDLDHFKHVNDTLGHDAGDALLVEAAERLRHAVREADRVARLGGDEFAVLLAPGSDAAISGQICQRIVGSMARPIQYGAVEMRVGVSIGGAKFTGEGNVDTLYKAADLALYQAKAAGRNTWRIAGPVV
ncbi:diguanylate cyclase [Massilia sp. TW-1]|uniref:Diguanylate cyclase n=1 Tax=Telluria antibiotica TaxID=2717319 RepID=A0ABX0PHD6_9BURK|nr:ligand-binding sensor domain-containing diguanylate cyclase [Telluria antibiotica]NIA56840.1 diguanylate cyclase [Telluria antibiotica]